MALVLKRLYRGYFWLFEELADPRANNYFLASSPLVPLAIGASYLYFVNVLGPKLMQNRKPFELKRVLVLYNLSQIIFNIILAFQVYDIVYHMSLFGCNYVDYTESPMANNTLRICFSYYLLKVYDLMDTIFIILKKNMRQVSFLHVYHHCGMVIGGFITTRFVAGGELIWTGNMNLIVHAVMYTYYLLASLDSKWKKNLAIKKFLTQLQLCQFALNIIIYGRLFFMPDCHFPRLIAIVYVPQNIFMMALFGDFYIKAYILNKPKELKIK